MCLAKLSAHSLSLSASAADDHAEWYRTWEAGDFSLFLSLSPAHHKDEHVQHHQVAEEDEPRGRAGHDRPSLKGFRSETQKGLINSHNIERRLIVNRQPLRATDALSAREPVSETVLHLSSTDSIDRKPLIDRNPHFAKGSILRSYWSSYVLSASIGTAADAEPPTK